MDEITNITIAQKLVAIRKSNELSINKLASLMNVSRNTILNYEKGKATPNFLYMIKFAILFNFSLDEFVKDYNYLKETVKNLGKENPSTSFKKKQELIPKKPLLI